MALSSQFRTYSSMSGVDIKVTIAGKAIGSVQGISYSVQREKAPIYTMGSADLRGIARGKRGIAGSLVFIQFEEEPILSELANPSDPNRQLFFLSDIDDLRPAYDVSVLVNETQISAVEGSANFPGAAINQQESDVVTAGSDQAKAIPWYPDQLPAVDIVLTAANEYGGLAIMKILGAEIMNQGYGVSIDDIVSEHSYTFIAHSLVPWTSQGMHPDMINANPS